MTASDKILTAIRALRRYRDGDPYVPLAWLREETGLIRPDFDTAVISLAENRQIELVENPYPRHRTAGDDEAAIMWRPTGAEWVPCHLAAIH